MQRAKVVREVRMKMFKVDVAISEDQVKKINLKEKTEQMRLRTREMEAKVLWIMPLR
jgi:hypothetical protein